MQKENKFKQKICINNNTVLVVEPRGFTGDGIPYFVASSEENAKKYMFKHMYYLTGAFGYWVTYNQKLNKIQKVGRNGENLNYYHLTGEKAKDLDEINNLYLEKRKVINDKNDYRFNDKEDCICDRCEIYKKEY